MWLITLILSIAYIIWLTKLINFGVATATRIAVATEATALSVTAMYDALSPEAKERVERARIERYKEAGLREATKEAASLHKSNTVGFLIAGTAAAVLVLLLSMGFAHAGERDQSRSFYDRNGSFAGSSIQHGNSTSLYDKSGHFSGSAIRNSDGSTSFYDRSGRFTGSSTNTSQRK